MLHDQEPDPVLAADVMKRANVRVVQAGDGLGLALEPLLQVGVRGDMLGQHLDGDGAVQAGVAGFVDLAHPTRANGREALVRAERGAWLQGHQLTGTRALSSSNQFSTKIRPVNASSPTV